MSKITDTDQVDTYIPKRSLLERILEILPGFISWIVITSPVWLTLRLPSFMAALIIFVDVYWFYRAIKTAILGFVGYRRVQKAIQTDWQAKLNQDFPEKWETLEHLFIIPSWKESGDIIESSFAGIAKTEYPLSKIRVVLALEARDDPDLISEKEAVAEKYRSIFANVFVTKHPDNLVGEVIGPGANRTWSLKSLIPLLEKEINVDQTILTTLDADFIIHPKLVSALTYQYLATPDPAEKSFTGIFIYSNNYWQAPAPMRLISSSVALSQLGELVENWKYVNFSSHSLNLRTLVNLGFWTVDHVNDDAHLYWKAYFATDGKYQVIPHWIPIYADTVLDRNLPKTFVNQYKQLQRWAYGVEHRPYIYRNIFTKANIPLISRFERFLFVFRSDIAWATLAFITGFGASIAVLVNRQFSQTVLGSNLVLYSGIILSFATIGMIPAAILNLKLYPPMPSDWSKARKLFGYLQYLLAPLVVMTFGTLPAIDSQSRLMFGKYLSYRVTRKFRIMKK